MEKTTKPKEHAAMMDGADRNMAREMEMVRRNILRRTPEQGDCQTVIPSLILHRRDEANLAENCFYQPIFAYTAQGAKRTIQGNEEYRYGEGECLLAGVDMPSLSHITEASPEKPYLVVSVKLDSQLISQLVTEIPSSRKSVAPVKGTAVAPVDPDVLRALSRLISLLDEPEQVSVLAPLYLRELHYRLLIGPQGEHLRLLNTNGTQSNQVFRAITLMRRNFKEAMEIDELARYVNMAPPTFRRHFKTITTMSPLQYQKRLRLYEAQRLMLVENSDAVHASYAVGYESPTQFSREYKRLFGESPRANVSHIRMG